MRDVFVAYASNNPTYMSSIEFFKLSKNFGLYPVRPPQCNNLLGQAATGCTTEDPD
jgi:hypothetical protein